jgi:hypothetical protein
MKNNWQATGWCFVFFQSIFGSQSIYSMDSQTVKDKPTEIKGSKSDVSTRAKVDPQYFERLPESLQEAILFASAAEIIKSSSRNQLKNSVNTLKNSKNNKDQSKSWKNEHFWLIPEGNPAKDVDVLSREQTLILWQVMPTFIAPELLPLVNLFWGEKIEVDQIIKIIQANPKLSNYTDYAGRTIYHLALRFAMEAKASEDWVGFFEKILTDLPVPLNMQVNLEDKFGNSLITYVCCLVFSGKEIHREWLKVAELIVGQSYKTISYNANIFGANIFGLDFSSLVQPHLPTLMHLEGVYAKKMHNILKLLSASKRKAATKYGFCELESLDI